jgi:hypothetical protein
MKEFDVCIIILNWNGYEVTRECLLSLQKISYPNYTIILVDNGSSDNSVENLSKEFSQVDCLNLDKNYGFTGGNNKGIIYAINKYNPDFFLLLNNDTEVKSDFLDQLILPFHENGNIFATVPKIYFFNKKDIIWCAGGEIAKLTGIVTEYGKNQKDTDKTSYQREIGFMSGCAVLLSAITIKEIGLLDEMFFAYSEDTDYSLRILKTGHSIVYVPDSIVYHKVSQSFVGQAGIQSQFYLATRNFILLQRKHLPKFLFPVFIFVLLFRWVIYISLKLALMGHLMGWKAICKGLYDGLCKPGTQIT